METTTDLGKIWCKEYECMIDVRETLEQERDMLYGVVQFYGPLPFKLTHPEGVPDIDAPTIYTMAHDRLVVLNEILGRR